MLTLKTGDKAPTFSAIDQNGNKVSLKDFIGKRLVLFFYPQAGTPTCTVEACNLRDHFSLLKKKGLVIVGVSPDEGKNIYDEQYSLYYRKIPRPKKH